LTLKLLLIASIFNGGLASPAYVPGWQHRAQRLAPLAKTAIAVFLKETVYRFIAGEIASATRQNSI